MLHAFPDAGFDQRARCDRIVGVVRERVPYRIGSDDRSGEVNDGRDRIVVQKPPDHDLVADMALMEVGAIRHKPAHSGGEVVEHDDIEIALERGVNHVAADIAGSAGDQNGHEESFRRRLSG